MTIALSSSPAIAEDFRRLSVQQLRTHPKNIRRVYPAEGIRELANSIQSNGGVWQPLIVTPTSESDVYVVIDGNRRHRAAQSLGDACPMLECKIVSADLADQMLAMITVNFLREDPDPISEALHYRLLITQERLSQIEVARRSGVALVRVSTRLRLLALDDELQTLIAAGELPSDKRSADALMSIPDSAVRIELARRLAEDRASIKAIVLACNKAVERLGRRNDNHRRRGRPAGDIASITDQAITEADLPGGPMRGRAQLKADVTMPYSGAASVATLREAARNMCSTCDTRVSQLGGHVEPAWLLISQNADAICERCNVRTVAGACASCPGVELLRSLLVAKKANRS